MLTLPSPCRCFRCCFCPSTCSNYSANFTFLTVPGIDFALPIDQGMFEYIMGKAQKGANMMVYEQDWLGGGASMYLYSYVFICMYSYELRAIAHNTIYGF